MNKISKKSLSLWIGLVLILVFTYAFWPKPILVDLGEVVMGDMQLTIDEEGYTRVVEQYQISAPISGHMLRVALEPGDTVEQGLTVVARMLPNPLTAKELQQAKASVQAANANVGVAEATLTQAKSAYELAAHRAQRSAAQINSGAISIDENEQLQKALDIAQAAVSSASSMLAMRFAELENAKALQIGTDERNGNAEVVEIKSPITGKVLSVIEKSDKVLIAGEPIVLLGDFSQGIEIVIEMLSSDALQIKTGQQTLIIGWETNKALNGTITRIEPKGFIKTSALGVEERRVNVIVTPDNLRDIPSNVGHGFRVDMSVVLWQAVDTLLVPTSATFRDNLDWAVFVVEDGKAQLRKIEIIKSNGVQTAVSSGLSESEQVILYPSTNVNLGVSVRAR